MSFAHDPFRLEPVRANVLQEPQIHKEIYSLEKHIEQLSLSIHESRQRLKYEQQASKEPQARRRVKTSEYYTTMGTLPRRFEEPGIWKYKVKQQNPMYTTTSNQYGQMPPTVHDMPTVFRGQTSKFTEHLNMAGPYRNFSLNI
eukprot:jgi/Hompol1/245/HPOL_000394-RA